LIVPLVRISTEAENDIDQIASYTISNWGTAQADRYLNKLEDGISALGNNPLIGRPCDSLQRGLRRLEIEKHVVFYLPEPDGVLIVRVLHCTMLPTKHL
jgi:toxin ParE1/3/4